MKEYLSSIIIISIAVCLLELIAPNNERMMRLIGALCIICVTIAPINEMMGELSTDYFDELRDKLTEESREELGNDYSIILNDYLHQHSVDAYNKQIKELLSTEFNISDNECEVHTYTQFTNNEFTVTEIQILLKGNSIFKNPYDIEDYIAKICSAKCKVLIK